MADKQTGTGAKGDSSRRPKGQGSSERGNHTKTSTDNRSQQIKGDNNSNNKQGRRGG
jgi:hypothetical protein